MMADWPPVLEVELCQKGRPARHPLISFGFRQDVPCCQQAWVYVLAQLAGGLLAAAFSFPLYGLGADWARLWDRSSLRPHLHRRHHSRGTGSKVSECVTPKDPTLEVRTHVYVTPFLTLCGGQGPVTRGHPVQQTGNPLNSFISKLMSACNERWL